MACTIHKVPSGAARSVVELNPDEVELCVIDGVAELLIRYDALRGTRNVVLLLGRLCVVSPKPVDHGGVP